MFRLPHKHTYPWSSSRLMHLDDHGLHMSSSLDTRLAAGSADSIVLVIHREWPVWQLFKHIVDHALSSGSFLSKVIASSYEQPTFFVPRSRKGISRLWNPRYSFPCEQLRWIRLMPRDHVREMLTAKTWHKANSLTVRTACSWLRNGPTGGDLHNSIMEGKSKVQQ